MEQQVWFLKTKVVQTLWLLFVDRIEPAQGYRTTVENSYF